MAPLNVDSPYFLGVDEPDLLGPSTELPAASGDRSNQYVFIDPSIANVDSLMAQLPPSVRVAYLESDRGGLVQMAEVLGGAENVDSIHVFAHGEEGAVQLGSGLVGLDDLESYSDELAQIGASLTEGGDILFWGCDVASGSDGRLFASRVAELTGADVAASIDPTGSEDLGGDWELEFQTGATDATLPFVADQVRGVLLPTASDGFGVFDEAFVLEGGLGSDGIHDIVADDSGNIYVTGRFEGEVDFDLREGVESTLSVAQSGAFVARYDAHGVLDWVTGLGSAVSNVNVEARGLALSNSGKVHVTGWFGGTAEVLGDNTVGIPAIDSLDFSDVFVASFDADNGEVSSLHGFGSSDQDAGWDIAVDEDDNVVVGGYFSDQIAFGADVVTPVGSKDAFVVSFDNQGDVNWHRTYGGNSYFDEVRSVAIGADNSVYATGVFEDQVDFLPSDPGGEVTALQGDVFLVKLDQFGSQQWYHTYEGSGYDEVYDIVVADSGLIYTSGSIGGFTNFDPDNVGHNVSVGSTSAFVAIHDANGDIHDVTAVSTSGTSRGEGVAVDADGNMTLVGYFNGSIDVGSETLTPDGGSGALFLAQFDPSGNPTFARAVGSDNIIEPLGVTLDASGRVLVAGFFGGTATFDSAFGAGWESLGYTSGFVAAYSASPLIPFGSPRQNVSIGYPRAAQLGDIDGDGKLDVVGFDYNTQQFSWYSSDSPLSWYQWEGDISSPISPGTEPLQIELADIDHDGWLDVVASMIDGELIWFRHNGDPLSMWDAPRTIAGGLVDIRDFQIFDADQEGLLDVVVVDSTKVRAYLGGQSPTDSWAMSPVRTTASARSVSVGDVDDDGLNDVIYTLDDGDGFVSPSEGIEIAIGDGSGVFFLEDQLGTLLAGPGFGLTSPENAPHDVVVSDIDGDGDNDIVAVWDEVVNWYENTGDGFSNTPNPISTQIRGVGKITISDLDQDGDLDVLATRLAPEREVVWFANQGDGVFGARQRVGDELYSTNLARPLTGDLDGDGDLDVAIHDGYQLTVAENIGLHKSATFPGSLANQQISSIAQKGPITWVDLDSDGMLDVIGPGSVPGELAFYQQTGYGYGYGGFSGSTLANFAQGFSGLATSDLDGDGVMEIVVAAPDGAWIIEENAGSFDKTLAASDGGIGYTQVALGDLDEDGWLDLVIGDDAGGIRVSLSDGSGRFSSALNYGGGSGSITSLDVVDLDGDGNLDVIWSDSSGGIGWRLGAGDGTVSGSSVGSVAGPVRDVHGVDIDGDGDTDIVATVPDFDGVILIENQGAGSYAGPYSLIGGGSFKPSQIDVADIDLDGDLDIVGLASDLGQDDTIVLYENNQGYFHPVPTEVMTGLPRGRDLALADVDGDGDLDVTWLSFDQGAGQIAWSATQLASVSFDVRAEGSDIVEEGVPTHRFTVEVSHLGRSGDAQVEISTLRFDLDDLTTGEGPPIDWSKVIEDVVVFHDRNFDGQLDGGDEHVSKGFVVSTGNFAELTVDLEVYEDLVPGGDATFFVELILEEGASDLVPNAKFEMGVSGVRTNDVVTGLTVSSLPGEVVGPQAVVADVAGDPHVVSAVGPESSSQPTIEFLVSFSEGVSGVTPSDFDLQFFGNASGGIFDVYAVSSRAYRVVVSVDSNSVPGGIALVVNDIDGSIVDIAGNQLLDGSGVVISDPVSIVEPPVSFDNIDYFQTPSVGQGEYLAQADIDGDGTLDLILAGFDGGFTTGITWHRGNGDLSFDETGLVIRYLPEEKVTSIQTDDVDGDGDVDIVVGTDSRIVWYENQSKGNQWGNDYEITNGAAIEELQLADVDGDGDRDLVALRVDDEFEEGSLVWFANMGGSYDGVFDYYEMQIAGSDTGSNSSIAIADVNGDGTEDVVLLNWSYDELSWFANDGSGSPSPWTRQTIGDTGAVEYESDGYTLLTGDFDRDGDEDIVVGSYSAGGVFLFENLDGKGAFGTPGDLLASGLENLYDVRLVDIDADGDLDLLTSGTAQVVDSPETVVISWFVNDGKGGIAANHTLHEPEVDLAVLSFGDYDRDGDIDFVSLDTSGEYVDSFENRSLHSATVLVQNHLVDGATLDDAQQIEFADLDGDGDLDVVASFGPEVERFGWYENLDGAGTLATVRWIAGNVGTDFRLADVNNDGDIDLVSYDPTDLLRVFENDLRGGGGWQQVVSSPGNNSSGASYDLADMDDDGDLDLVVALEGPFELFWLENDGQGQFTNLQSAQNARIASLDVGDLDGDGDSDIVAVGPQLGGVGPFVIFDNYDDYGSLNRVDGLATGPAGDLVRLGDMNNDNRLDVVVGNSATGDLRIYANNGDGTFSQVYTFSGSGPIDQIEIADLDKDGDLDVMVGRASASGFVLVTNHLQDGNFQVGTVDTGLGSATSFAFGDLDRDGDLDVAAALGASGISWIENQSSPVGIAMDFSLTPSAIDRSQPGTESLLSFIVTHNGHSSDDDISVETLSFAVVDQNGTPVSKSDLEALFDSFVLIEDLDGDGQLGVEETQYTLPSSSARDGLLTFGVGNTMGHGDSTRYLLHAVVASDVGDSPIDSFRIMPLLEGVEASHFLQLAASSMPTIDLEQVAGLQSPAITVLGLPEVVAIDRVGPATTASNVVEFDVTFSHHVAGLDPTDFSLHTTGGVTGVIGSIVVDSPTQWTVTVTGVSGEGELGLDFVDNDTVLSEAAVPIGGPGIGNGDFVGQRYVVDTIAPSAPVIAGISTDSGVNGGDGITTDQTLLISGSAEAFSIVEVFVDGGSVGSTSANGSGNWSYLHGVPLAEGAHVITATATDSLGNISGLSSPYAATIDRTGPVLDAIHRLSPASPVTNADSLVFLATFDEAVTTIDMADFQVSGGSTAGVVSLLSADGGAGLAWSVTVAGGDLDSYSGAVGLDLAPSASIDDLAGNSLVVVEPDTNEEYVLDNTVPEVAITLAGASPTDSSIVVFDVVFSEDVANVDATDFGLALVGVTADTPVGVDDAGDADASTYRVTVSNVFGAGLLGLDIAATTDIVDVVGNALDQDLEINQVYTVAALLEPVADFVAPSNVAPDQSVQFDGSPSFHQNPIKSLVEYTWDFGDGSPTEQGVTVSHAFSTFGTYTVTLTVTDSSDPAMSDSVSYLVAVDQGNVSPTVLSAGGPYSIGQTDDVIALLATATDPNIPNGDYLTFEWDLDNDGEYDDTTGPTPSLTSGQVAGLGLGLGVHTIALRVTDIFGEEAFGSTTLEVIDSVAPDAPTISMIADDAGVPGDQVTNDNTPTLSGAAESFGRVEVFLDGALLGSTNADGEGSWAFAVVSPLADGTHTFRGQTTDQAGNVSGLSAPFEVTIDTEAPRIESIDSLDAFPTNVPTVNFLVTFNEAVLSLDSVDFEVTTSGTATGVIQQVTPNGVAGDEWIVTVAGVAGDGSLRLDFVDDGSAVDLAGNQIDEAGLSEGRFAGAAIVIDQSVPEVTSIDLLGGPSPFSESITYLVTMSKVVFGVDASDFALLKTGNVTGQLGVQATSDPLEYLVTVSGLRGDGTIELALAPGAMIVDGAGQSVSGPFLGDDVHIVFDPIGDIETGQFSVVTTDISPAGLSEGRRTELLEVVVSNNGTPGDHSLLVETFTFAVDQTSSDPNSVIESLTLYRDINGDGVIDPAVDVTVQHFDTISLSEGLFSIDVLGSGFAEVGPGASATFVLMVELTADAGDQAPPSLRVTHLSGLASARDSVTNILGVVPLTQSPPGVTVAASLSVASSIPDVSVFEDAPTTFLNLPAQFGPGTTFSIPQGGVSKPSLFAQAPYIDGSGRLVLDYLANTSGTSSITLEVTNAQLGFSFFVTFNVNVLSVNDAPTGPTFFAAGAGQTTINLPSLYSDVEQSGAGLTYTLRSVANGTLFDSAAIVGNQLVVDYASAAFGRTTLLVRATDASGAFIETTFQFTGEAGATPISDPWEANDTAEFATPVGPGGAGDPASFLDPATNPADVAVFANVDVAGDADFYRFRLSADSQVTLRTIADQLGGTLDTVMTLYDPAGNVIASSDDLGGKDSFLKVSLAASAAGESYTVKVRGFERSTGNYRLQIQTQLAGPRIVRMIPDETVGESPQQIRLYFDSVELDPATLSSSLFQLEQVDAEGNLIVGGDRSELISGENAYDAENNLLILTLSGVLEDGRYRLTANDEILSADGVPLDGDGIGGAGGDFVDFFSVDTTAPVSAGDLRVIGVAGSDESGVLYRFAGAVSDPHPATAGEEITIELDVDGDGVFDDGLATVVLEAGATTFQITSTTGIASDTANPVVDVFARFVDARGNTSAPVTATLNTIAPKVTKVEAVGETIVVTFDGTNLTNVGDPSVYEVSGKVIGSVLFDPATNTATLSFEDGLAEGSYSVSVLSGPNGINRGGIALDGDGDASPGGNFLTTIVADRTGPTLDTFELAQESDTGVDANDNLTNKSRPTFRIVGGDLFPVGAAGELTALVELTPVGQTPQGLFDDGSAVLGLGESGVSEEFFVTIDTPLPGGDYLVSLKLIDASGNELRGENFDFQITVDRTGPRAQSLTWDVIDGGEGGGPVGVQFFVDFSEEVDEAGALDPSSYSLLAAGGDGGFGDGNETLVESGFEIEKISATRYVLNVELPEELAGITDDYQLTVHAGTISDLAGNLLSGSRSIEVFYQTVGPRVETVTAWSPLASNLPNKIEVQFNDRFGLRGSDGVLLAGGDQEYGFSVDSEGVITEGESSSEEEGTTGGPRITGIEFATGESSTTITLSFDASLLPDQAVLGSNYVLHDLDGQSFRRLTKTTDLIEYDAEASTVTITIAELLEEGDYRLDIDGTSAEALRVETVNTLDAYLLEKLDDDGNVIGSVTLASVSFNKDSNRVLISLNQDGVPAGDFGTDDGLVVIEGGLRRLTAGTYRLTLADSIENRSGLTLEDPTEFLIVVTEPDGEGDEISSEAVAPVQTSLETITLADAEASEHATKDVTKRDDAERIRVELEELAESLEEKGSSSEEIATAVNERLTELYAELIESIYSEAGVAGGEFIVAWARGARFLIADPDAPDAQVGFGIGLDAIEQIDGATLVGDLEGLTLAVIPVLSSAPVSGGDLISTGEDGSSVAPSLEFLWEREGLDAVNQLGIVAFGSYDPNADEGLQLPTASEMLLDVDRSIVEATFDVSGVIERDDPNLGLINETFVLEIEDIFGAELPDGIYAWFDPVGFVLEDSNNNRVGNDGVGSGNLNEIDNAYYSNDATTEVLIIPDSAANNYSLTLVGAGGEFRGGFNVVQDGEVVASSTFQGNASAGQELALVLDFSDVGADAGGSPTSPPPSVDPGPTTPEPGPGPTSPPVSPPPTNGGGGDPSPGPSPPSTPDPGPSNPPGGGPSPPAPGGGDPAPSPPTGPNTPSNPSAPSDPGGTPSNGGGTSTSLIAGVSPGDSGTNAGNLLGSLIFTAANLIPQNGLNGGAGIENGFGRDRGDFPTGDLEALSGIIDQVFSRAADSLSVEDLVESALDRVGIESESTKSALSNLASALGRSAMPSWHGVSELLQQLLRARLAGDDSGEENLDEEGQPPVEDEARNERGGENVLVPVDGVAPGGVPETEETGEAESDSDDAAAETKEGGSDDGESSSEDAGPEATLFEAPIDVNFEFGHPSTPVEHWDHLDELFSEVATIDESLESTVDAQEIAATSKPETDEKPSNASIGGAIVVGLAAGALAGDRTIRDPKRSNEEKQTTSPSS
ncbi:FG-GAP repeat protein [Planctomycetes bacterium Pan216]|uniref:FG-GAP repeat protein n=2 Tax=Kolteria novifilia TaxID=2527975 RepID=A0A518B3Z6_9BACT|nr:FG-GAP repeat protein [Planctomycetes bacterium Pan216]